MTLLSTVLFGALGLGVMVFIHELGHFLAARANGVHVEVFSLGWGTRLVGVHHRGTWYQISWLPLGGYCKMRGDEALREVSASHDGAADAAPAEEGSFNAAATWRRIVIIAAGPLANLLSAALLLTLLWGAGFWVRSEPSRVVLAADFPPSPVPEETPAEAAGLQTGDVITAVDGRAISTFQELGEGIATSPERPVELLLLRDGRTLSASITPSLDVESLTGRIWVYPWLDPVVAIAPGGSGESAAVAGLRGGDRVVAVNGTRIEHTVGYAAARRASGGEAPLALTVERDGATVDMKLPPGAAINFVLPRFRMRGGSIVDAIARGVEETGRTIGLTVRGLGLLFRGNAASAVAGPIRISYYVGAATSQGFQESLGAGLVEFTRLIARISVVLFLMNLLPVPALDGGHIALYLVELIRGRPVRPALVYQARRIGFSLLLVLAVALTFSDIRFLVGGAG